MGVGEVLVLVSVIALVFGARRLPQLGSALGETLKSFKKGIRGQDRELRHVDEYQPKKPGDDV